MGINFILPLIAGIVMTVILGTQVAPSFVENMKIAKVENRTMSNQDLIKDAIVRYIKINGVVPDPENGLGDLDKLMREHHKENLFDGEYSFFINKEKGTLTISTIISDESASKYFSNSFKSPNKPICTKIDPIDSSYNCETFYLLDDEIFKSIATPSTPTPPPAFGSIEDIEERFTDVAEVGEKFDGTTPEKTLVTGAKDYIVDMPNNQVTEYVYDGESWNENPTKIVVSSLNPSDHGVEIKDIEVPQQMMDTDGNRYIENKLFEKVICNENSIGKEVFVINENTGLGEIIWVAPDNTSGGTPAATRQKFFTNGFTPNNICTSNVKIMNYMFYNIPSFNQPLDRWDISNVKDMTYMFQQASSFDQDLDSWDTSNVETMISMFGSATSFNGDISSWNVSKVTSMLSMLNNTTKFNQDISKWDTSNVTNMGGMFASASIFYKDLSKWCVTNIKSKPGTFDRYTGAWENKTALQPKWGTCPLP